MVISTKGRYALRLMLDIAMQDGTSPVPLHDIAERQGVSFKYLEQIVPPLSKAGFLKSVRGANGGYLLTRDPSEITTGDILRAGEGNLAPVACLASDEIDCPRADLCVTLPFWKGLDEAITAYIDSVTLADLVKDRAV
ncbi:MAG: RrF2 family transcriptional regulator [Coriobacteriales bacterium]|nr:Rrf2 family transcriptional regulator [Coriobacteriales bacterium]MDD6739594.1 Rrf2 family transcriptional regulator [Coriobacteriaceae bacterium]MDD6768445.1 Rrf2 family transcriptional regulator [Coriobacteriaceae bacterium]